MTRPAMELRPAGAGEAALLETLHRQIFTSPWDQEWNAGSFRRILAMPGAAAWVLVQKSKPKGFAIVLVGADQAELILIGILVPERRKGLGRKIIEGACREAASRGATRIYLEHALDDAVAHAFYVSAGFRPTGKRPNYYQGRTGSADALVMVRDLA